MIAVVLLAVFGAGALVGFYAGAAFVGIRIDRQRLDIRPAQRRRA